MDATGIIFDVERFAIHDGPGIRTTDARQIVGRQVTAAQVMAQVEREVIYYDESGGGATFLLGLDVPKRYQGREHASGQCRKETHRTSPEVCGRLPRFEFVFKMPAV